jgi:hypothetical protein
VKLDLTQTVNTSPFPLANINCGLILAVCKFYVQYHVLHQCNDWAMGWTTEESLFVSRQIGDSLLHSISTDSRGHPASCPMGTRDSSPVGKVVRL